MTYQPPPVTAGALRLHYNENTAGCSPAVLTALRSMTREDASLYPDYSAITRTTERWFGVDEGWIHLTNGLDEGLQLAALWARLAADRAAGSTSTRLVPEVVIVDPAFEMYDACAESVGAAIVRIPPEPDFEFPLARILAALTPATRLINLTDPNNPTGLPIPAGAIETIAAAAPQALVLVDEAYADFSDRTIIGAALDRRRNIVAGRTFAKAHGLAALRIGALVGHPDTLEGLRRLAPPFSVNVCAMRALDAALADRDYLEWCVTQSASSRQRIYDFCARHDLTYWPSHANFVLLKLADRVTRVVDGLRARGITVRDKSAAPGCDGCLRLTAGVVEHTDRALSAMEEILAPRPR
jgi:histidinol-phosphate aminotransferase